MGRIASKWHGGLAGLPGAVSCAIVGIFTRIKHDLEQQTA